MTQFNKGDTVSVTIPGCTVQGPKDAFGVYNVKTALGTPLRLSGSDMKLTKAAIPPEPAYRSYVVVKDLDGYEYVWFRDLIGWLRVSTTNPWVTGIGPCRANWADFNHARTYMLTAAAKPITG